MTGIVHEGANRLSSTRDLIDHYALRSTIPRADLELAIPAAIDAVYGRSQDAVYGHRVVGQFELGGRNAER